jgi:branched-chain amino acid transport system substrate-binding protein
MLPFGRIGNFLSSILVVSMLLAGLSACSQIGGNNAATTQDQKPITIGYSVSITGDFSSDGKAVQQGYELWRDSVNQRGGLLGRPVQLKFYDDGSDTDRASANYKRLIETDHVDLLLGPFSTKLTVPTMHVADQYGYAFIGGAGNGKKAFQQTLQNKNFFMASLPSETALDTFSQFLLSLPFDLRPKTVAYVAVDDPFAVPQVSYAKGILSKSGLKTVFNEPAFSSDLKDATPIAKRVAESHADVVVFGTVGLDLSVNFIKTFAEQNYNPKAFIATSGPDEGAVFMKAVGAKAAEGTFVPNSGWYPGINTFQSAQFVQEYIAKYGGKADDINSGTVQGYSAGQVLEQAVTQAKSLDNKTLIKTLHDGTFNNLFGPVKFNDQGQNTLGVYYLFQWQAGRLIPVYPDSQAQANPEYPKSPWS